MFGFSIVFLIVPIVIFCIGMSMFIYLVIKATKNNSQIFKNVIDAQNKFNKQNSSDNVVETTCNTVKDEEFEFCEYCGSKMPKSARRCPNCGARK